MRRNVDKPWAVAEHFRFDAAKLRALLGHRAEVLWFDQIAAIVFADSRR